MEPDIVGMCVGAVCGFVIGVMICAITDYDSGTWREGISRGYAEYCPQDNQFAWKGECK